ncbi:MAG: nucleotide-binding domain containing protein [Pseudomonadota bacterium]
MGSEAIPAGSCSGATLGQVAWHGAQHPTLTIDVPSVMAGGVGAEDLVAFIAAYEGLAPLVTSSGWPEDVAALQSRYGRATVAAKLDALFAATAQRLVQTGHRRIAVAGGETASAVAHAITDCPSTSAMHIGAEMASEHQIPVALALKSGNFGAEDFFVEALRAMVRPAG